tara:strand:+ start:1343 stop:1690 length:348 start_codon:yes stop_codon:yes gene_type:complete
MANYSGNKRTYYSDTKPKGKGSIDVSNYDYDMANVIEKVYYNNPSILGVFSGSGIQPRQKEEVAQIQSFLKDIGYLDSENEIDSLYGPKTSGASHRYLLNKPGTLARVIDWIGNE